jgi:hypothetical protein
LQLGLKKKNPAKAHRISAQRTLTFPKDFRGSSVEVAERVFLYGHESYTEANAVHKFQPRYGNAHDVQLNDFQKLVTLLFSEGAQVREEYVQKMKAQTDYEPPPVRKLDLIQRIWDEILPNRELLIGGHQIESRKRGSTIAYSPDGMSDGERVIFYLIGQCLCAPKDGVILLDEPELHLHRALQTRLWDAVEAERRDCLFVYITHDLDFAASRQGGTHVWLSEYSGGENWEWDEVPDGSPLPDALLLEVLGSRKPILFVEGTATKKDDRLYRVIYPDHHVMALGSCGEVIHATASCRQMKQNALLNVDTLGLIDRDGRTDEDLGSLAKIGVSALEWAEIENLLVNEELVMEVSKALHREPGEDMTKIKESVFEVFSRDAERIAAELAGRDLDRAIRAWGWKHKDGQTLESSFTGHFEAISPKEAFKKRRDEISRIIDEKDYTKALRLYPNKGLLPLAGRVLGLTKYDEYVLRLVTLPEGASLLEAMRKLTPVLTSTSQRVTPIPVPEA